MTHQHSLVTNRLTLRAPDRRDWPAYADFMESPAARFFKGHGDVLEAWKSFGTLIWHWIDRGYGPWAVTETGDDSCIGIIGPKCPPGWPEGEITWIAFAPAAGRGIAHEAARAALGDVFTRLGWTSAVSYIEDDNLPSIRLAERLGATRDDSAPVPGGPVRAWRHPAPETLQ
ncbi:GNAT family N-acetyltransferase [Nioella sp.]|uniref:GNAT family N-acetyltransferase n=1 Tax=Nioella sp. TaxID=1912091 RepID=UPI003A859C73